MACWVLVMVLAIFLARLEQLSAVTIVGDFLAPILKWQ